MNRPDASARLLVEVLGGAYIQYSFYQLAFQCRRSAFALTASEPWYTVNGRRRARLW
jgi:hypothetical protein